MPRFSTALVALLLLVSLCTAGPLNYSDGFEAPSFNSFWTPSFTSGTGFPSGAQVHSGNQAVQFNSVNTFGVNKNVYLTHTFAAPVYGRTSVWVYDTGADTFSSNYLTLALNNSQTNQARGILGYDYDLGPGQNGSTYYLNTPGEFETAIDRTRAWHEFVIDTTPDSTRFFIDGQLVFTQPSGYSFDQIRIGMFGPDWRPAWTGYFDDFSFTEHEAVATPEPVSVVVFGAVLLGVGAVGVWRRGKSTSPAGP